MPQPAPGDGPAASRDRIVKPRLRASDADRFGTVRLLQDALASGVLSPDEADDRMAATFAAVYHDELGPLTEDLPPAPPAPSPPGWRVIALMAQEQLRHTLAGGPGGRLNPARVALAVLIGMLVVVLIGFVTATVLFHQGGGFDPDGPGRPRFGHDGPWHH